MNRYFLTLDYGVDLGNLRCFSRKKILGICFWVFRKNKLWDRDKIFSVYSSLGAGLWDLDFFFF